MINVADLPAVRAQIERAAATNGAASTSTETEATRYARAPVAAGPQQTGVRPPATQGETR